jgi:predicted dehydrogenase
MKTTLLTLSTLVLALTAAAPLRAAEPVRIGMIGLDTSHVPAFAKLFNNPKATGDLSGFKVVAGYPGGTDMPSSATRIKGFTEGLRTNGVEIVDTIPALLAKVDVVLLESVDGRVHFAEASQVIKAGKPIFIDKPMAGSLAEVIALFELGKKHKVPIFSSSSLRYGAALQAALKDEKLGKIKSANTWGPSNYSPGIPDLFFYGIHGVEPLYTIMGTGCDTVARIQTTDADDVTGVWKDGRVGKYKGARTGKGGSGATIVGANATVNVEKPGGYEDLCKEIGKFFKTGKSPIPEAETIEIFTFMEAAQVSKDQGGAPVKLETVLAKARVEAAKLVK